MCERIQVEIEEDQRQMVLLALAHLAVERPGFDDYLGEIADRFAGRTLFDTLAQLRRDETIGRLASMMPGPGRDGH